MGSVTQPGMSGKAHFVFNVDQFYWYLPANTRRWPNDGLMLDGRRKQWPNIGPSLGQRLVFAGVHTLYMWHKISMPIIDGDGLQDKQSN